MTQNRLRRLRDKAAMAGPLKGWLHTYLGSRDNNLKSHPHKSWHFWNCLFVHPDLSGLDLKLLWKVVPKRCGLGRPIHWLADSWSKKICRFQNIQIRVWTRPYYTCTCCPGDSWCCCCCNRSCCCCWRICSRSCCCIISSCFLLKKHQFNKVQGLLFRQLVLQQAAINSDRKITSWGTASLCSMAVLVGRAK